MTSYFVHNVTNKILTRVPIYIVYVVMWPKFGNSSISTRKVIITSILRIWPEKQISWGVVLVLGMTLKVYSSMAEGYH